jgi:ABC-type multidrug transport system fused ATPase/permease subunit
MKFDLKPNLQTLFFILGFVILYFINLKNIDPSEALKVISIPLLTLPFILLGIYAITNIKNGIRKYYQKEHNKIMDKIKELRLKQTKSQNDNEFISLERDILYAAGELNDVQSDRFEKNSIVSAFWFLVTIFILYLDLGTYINIPSKTLGVVSFLVGIYYLSDMLKALLNGFKE